MVLGALLHEPEKPGWFLPVSGRLYFRQSQLPTRPGEAGTTEPFRTKCELAVELLREQARMIPGRHLGVFDGGYALESVVRPLVLPDGGAARVDFLTRLRRDAQLFALPLPAERRPGGSGGPSRSGASGWPRPAGAATGSGVGEPGPRSSTAGSGRSAGRRSSACGMCWDGRCRSRRSSPRSRDIRSGSPW